MNYQDIIVYALLILAVGYLLLKILKQNNGRGGKKGNCGNGNCSCS
ncbi:FeoB-associated Cys-rich membrane protein [Myroides indicus]|uniref:Attachment p12 family protein n=1 Tax=Myroides indicus TaxID=1323422 RepID=A0A4V3E9I7_9FLAO|nr:FeoB-associated Cys-rich membrane protein [Myroides indicus]TDS65221.1 attachment p12 family protein [Myroides indicus]